MNSEMILTCLSSFAQAESESINGNVTKGIRMATGMAGSVSDIRTSWAIAKGRMVSRKLCLKKRRSSG